MKNTAHDNVMTYNKQNLSFLPTGFNIFESLSLIHLIAYRQWKEVQCKEKKIVHGAAKDFFFWVVTSVVLEKYGKKGWAISAISVLIPQNGDYFYTWILSQAAFERKWGNSWY